MNSDSSPTAGPSSHSHTAVSPLPTSIRRPSSLVRGSRSCEPEPELALLLLLLDLAA
jgi:hypothetical protein